MRTLSRTDENVRELFRDDGGRRFKCMPVANDRGPGVIAQLRPWCVQACRVEISGSLLPSIRRQAQSIHHDECAKASGRRGDESGCSGIGFDKRVGRAKSARVGASNHTACQIRHIAHLDRPVPPSPRASPPPPVCCTVCLGLTARANSCILRQCTAHVVTLKQSRRPFSDR